MHSSLYIYFAKGGVAHTRRVRAKEREGKVRNALQFIKLTAIGPVPARESHKSRQKAKVLGLETVSGTDTVRVGCIGPRCGAGNYKLIK